MNDVNLCVLGMLVCCMGVSSCGQEAEEPRSFVRWKGRSTEDDRDWAEWGAGGHHAYATVIDESPSLLAYGWTKDGMAEVGQVRLGKRSQMDSLWLPGRRFLTLPMGDIPRRFLVRSAPKGAVRRQYELPRGWWVARLGLSVSGRYAALALNEESTEEPEGFDWDRPRIRVALLDTSTMAFSVVTDVMGASDQSCVVPSDDGQYVGLAGLRNQAAVVRVRDKRVLWNTRPPDEISLEYIALATKRGTAYIGGNSGVLYAADLETGKIKNSWPAREPGEKGFIRITSIAVSPDGKYVAAGTHPHGRAYVWSTTTGKLERVFGGSPGAAYVLVFSPDSRRIAGFCPGWVMTGSLPEPDAAGGPARGK